MFDAMGPAGGDQAYQWVEVAVNRAIPDGSAWSLSDEAGNSLVTLPAISLPVGTFVLVLFGAQESSIDDFDPADGSILVTTGHAWGTALNNLVGGVRLLNNGGVVDEIYWGGGVGAPQFPMGYSAGQVVAEGESIGRNARSYYSGVAADWSISGGANSNGATPGEVNIVMIPERDDMLWHQQALVGELIINTGDNHEGVPWLDMTDSSPTIDVYRYSPQSPNAVFLRSNADIGLMVHGVPVLLGGKISTNFLRATVAYDVSEKWTTTGALYNAAGDVGISFTLVVEYRGAHGLSWSETIDATSTWREGGVDYEKDVHADIVCEYISDFEFRLTDTRSGSDYGGAGVKVANATTSQVKLGDGVYRTSVALHRDWPIQAPVPGGSQVLGTGGGETLVAVNEITVDVSSAASSGRIITYDQRLNGAVWAQLQPGLEGTISSFYTYPSAIERTWESFTSIPVVDAGGQSGVHEFTLGYTSVLTPTFESSAEDAFFQAYSAYGEVGLPDSGPDISLPRPKTNPRPGTPEDPKKGDDGISKGERAALIAISCVGTGFGATMTLGTYAGKRAAVIWVGKAVARKAIPVIGQVMAVGCCGYAIYDYFW